MRYGWAVMLAVMVLPLMTMGAVIEENVNYKGWKCVVLKNESTTVIVAPELSGRIIQYQTAGHDWLWVNESLAGKVLPASEEKGLETWNNYGGDKVWPGPQGWDRKDQWPGPGDPVIDAPYRYEIVAGKGQEVKLRLIGSDQGGWAGVQFFRELALKDGSSKLSELHTMKNVSNREVAWGIWEVAQMNWSDGATKRGSYDWNEDAYLVIPMNPRSRWPEKYRVMFGEAFSFNWQPDYLKNLMIVKYMNMVGKIVMDVSAGWSAMVDPASGSSFILRFPYDPKAVYPDGGNYESWVAGKGEFVHDHKLRVAADDPAGRLIEMEALGPKVTLKPGQSTQFKTSLEVVKGGMEALPK